MDPLWSYLTLLMGKTCILIAIISLLIDLEVFLVRVETISDLGVESLKGLAYVRTQGSHYRF